MTFSPGTSNASTDIRIGGHVSAGFEAVREAFKANFDAGLEVGASFAVCRRGEVVVDLFGGHTDTTRSVPLGEHSLFNLYSTTKGFAATCIATLVDRGAISYETPVSAIWPEFAQEGKQTVTIGQLMSHQAGLCGARNPTTIEDFYAHDALASALAAQPPLWEPGTAWGYHALTIGTLADEILRRVDGRTMSAFFAAEVAAPLALDAFLGLPEAEDGRQVPMIPPPESELPDLNIPNPAAAAATYNNPPFDPAWPNSRAWRAAGLPSAGGSSNARSLAKLYDVLANGGAYNGGNLLKAETIREASKERIRGASQNDGMFRRYSAGWQLNVLENMGPTERSFGHDGWGGSLAFADPEYGLGVGYVMNMMQNNVDERTDARVRRLLQATYAALQEL